MNKNYLSEKYPVEADSNERPFLTVASKVFHEKYPRCQIVELAEFSRNVASVVGITGSGDRFTVFINRDGKVWP